MITVGTMEVYIINLAAVDEKLNDKYPVSYGKYDKDCLFEDTNKNEEARIQFLSYKRHNS